MVPVFVLDGVAPDAKRASRWGFDHDFDSDVAAAQSSRSVVNTEFYRLGKQVAAVLSAMGFAGSHTYHIALQASLDYPIS